MARIYVLGGEQTDFARNWKRERKSMIAIFKEIIEDSFSKIDMNYDEIKELKEKNKIGLFVGNFNSEQYLNQGHLGAFFTEVNPVFYGIPSARYESACAASSSAIDAAISKIKCGTFDMAIVLGIELMKTVDSKTGGDYLGAAAHHETEAKGIEFPFPKLFARLADELIKKYNLNVNQFMDNLGEISKINYENAKRNPKAQTRQWFMEKEQTMNRGTKTNSLVAGRLAITDCSQVTDGAALVVLSSDNYAKKYCKQRGLNLSEIPYIKGWGHRVAPFQFSKKIKDSANSPYVLRWTRQAIVDAYNMANLTVEDIDFFETHDCFTSSEYASISSFGLTEPGKERKAIESGLISFTGDKPINPSGGLIGCGHPV